jgi:hypothetical protein
MPILILVVLGAVAFAVWRAVTQARGGRVHDAGGRVLTADFGGGSARAAGLVVGAVVTFILLAISFRTVPVGHALVIFNVLSHGFRIARQGVTFVPPFISNTAMYDLRRLEYTMSGVSGEGRRQNIDDSLWSPTRESPRSTRRSGPTTRTRSSGPLCAR